MFWRQTKLDYGSKSHLKSPAPPFRSDLGVRSKSLPCGGLAGVSCKGYEAGPRCIALICSALHWTGAQGCVAEWPVKAVHWQCNIVTS